jgi:DNA polymerase-1
MSIYLLIDGNSVGFASHSSTRLTAGDQETQAIFGVLRTVRDLMVKFPGPPIVCWDGVSWRKHHFTGYKANRDDTPEKKAVRDAYKAQRGHIARGLTLLGVTQAAAANLEADDIIAMLTAKLRATDKRVMVVSGDKDLLQLVQDRVVWYDPIRDRRVTTSNFHDFTGFRTTHQFVQAKALQGDTSDNVPGVGGIGEKGAKDLIERFGSVPDFLNDWLTGTYTGKIPKRWAEFGDEDSPGRDAYRRNMELMDLRSNAVPKPIGLKMRRKSLDREGFVAFCEEFSFQSILKDLDRFLEPFDPTNAAAAA